MCAGGPGTDALRYIAGHRHGVGAGVAKRPGTARHDTCIHTQRPTRFRHQLGQAQKELLVGFGAVQGVQRRVLARLRGSDEGCHLNRNQPRRAVVELRDRDLLAVAGGVIFDA